MEWSDLRIFLAVAREGTLGGAARKLGQTHPTMGRRVRALEESAGQALFQRTSAGYVLTDAGAAVLVHAERIEEEMLALERELAGQEQQLEGLLRVSSSDWFGVHVLTPVFAGFARTHPRVTIELVTDARMLSLVRREADIAFRIRPFEEAEVVQRKLMHLDYALYAAISAAHPTAGDGKGHALVTMDTAFGGMPDVSWLQRVLPNAHTAFRSNNRDAQARMCAAGVGLAVLPRLLAERTAGLERVEVGEAPPGRDVWVGYHRDFGRLARLRALLDATITHLGS